MTSLLKTLVLRVTFNVACELSQPMGKTEFSSTARNRTNCLTGKKKKYTRQSTYLPEVDNLDQLL